MTHDILTIGEDDDGQRLDRWLKKKRPDLPYVLVQKLLRKGQVRVDGKRAKPDQKLSAGQQVRMPLGSAEQDRTQKEEQRLDPDWLDSHTIYRDDDLIVLNKPGGLAVQGGSGLTFHLDMVLDAIGEAEGVRPRLVHRLDRETSGVLLLARRAAVARNLTAQFADRAVEKIYWALCLPAPDRESGTIDLPMKKVNVGTDLEKMQVTKDGLSAQTDYAVQKHGKDGVAFVEFRPRTGRTHQIRVHAAAAGFPLLGDVKYGGDAEGLRGKKRPVRCHLHARSITFAHPGSGEPMTITADLPDDLRTSWRIFGFEPS